MKKPNKKQGEIWEYKNKCTSTSAWWTTRRSETRLCCSTRSIIILTQCRKKIQFDSKGYLLSSRRLIQADSATGVGYPVLVRDEIERNRPQLQGPDVPIQDVKEQSPNQRNAGDHPDAQSQRCVLQATELRQHFKDHIYHVFSWLKPQPVDEKKALASGNRVLQFYLMNLCYLQELNVNILSDQKGSTWTS